ncbi:zinc-binding dehydrogenase [Phytohabitans flavus]|uniref:zinc-binding dehydrogenase n=1 Tax=Phytohabitans flavus TaxID=1076124 RepID=UPI00362C3A4A
MAGACGHRCGTTGAARSRTRRGGRGRPCRGADRQGARRGGDRHGERREARVRQGVGADEVIDYTTVDFTAAVRDVDVVVDTIGGEYGPRSLRVLKPGGLVVSLASPAEAALTGPAREAGKRAAFMVVEADQAGMREVAALAESGRLRVTIDRTLPLEQAARAHELGERGHTTGKIVLTL